MALAVVPALTRADVPLHVQPAVRDIRPSASCWRCRDGRSASWSPTRSRSSSSRTSPSRAAATLDAYFEGVHVLRAPPRPARRVDRHHVPAGDGARRRPQGQAGVHRADVARHPARRAAHAPGRLPACSCCAVRSSASSSSTATSTPATRCNTSRALAGFSLGLVGFSVYLFVLRGVLRPPGHAHPVRHQRVRERHQHRARRSCSSAATACSASALAFAHRLPGVGGVGAADPHLQGARASRCGRCSAASGGWCSPRS